MNNPSLSRSTRNLPLPDTLLKKRRKEWLSILADHPQAGISKLRTDQRIYSLHAWLSAHDKEWVKLHTPYAQRPKAPPTRLNWEEIDLQLEEAVIHTAQELREIPGHPVRITIESIGKKIGERNRLRLNGDKLPNTIKTLTNLVETKEDYAVRLIWWHAENYRLAHICPSLSQFMCRSGAYRSRKMYSGIDKAVEDAWRSLQEGCSEE